MELSILHLNIERHKHIDAVFNLIKEKNPDIISFQEAIHKDIEKIAKDLNYEFIFAPLLILKEENNVDEVGVAILSKYKIQNEKKYYYGDNTSGIPPTHSIKEISPNKNKRPTDRFEYLYTLLNASIEIKNNILNIATTHFPVSDHTFPGLQNHNLLDLESVKEIEHSHKYLETLIKIIRDIKYPLIFTSDLNNSRHEYFYDSIAHELVDVVPQQITSTIDPNLHRVKNLSLVVDTIMVSPNVLVQNCELIENVSDHKAIFATLKI